MNGSSKIHGMSSGCLPQGNSGSVPIVSPRNTSIPHPLPHQMPDIPQNTSPRRGIIDAPSLKLNGCALGGGVTGATATCGGAGLLPGLHMSTNAITPAKKVSPIEMEDLIHLPGPLTEDAVMKTLQARFNESKYFVSTEYLYNYKIHPSLSFCLYYKDYL
uniref:Uncharacterized protein n=1 Tax=Lutzomyia longipalpis TaxID=7200 RepID=A0A1B0CQX7_LUTLO